MLAVMDAAPDFHLDGIDGREYALRDALASGPALLVFCKTTCPACDLSLRYLDRLRATYGSRCSFWIVSQDNAEKSVAYSRRHDIQCPVIVDDRLSVSKQYDPAATPTLFLVDVGGKVRFTSYGFSKEDLNELSRLIASLLHVEPVVVAPSDDGFPAFRPG